VRGLNTWNSEGILYNDKAAYMLNKRALRLLYFRLTAIREDVDGSGGGEYVCQNAPGEFEEKRIAACLKDVGVIPMETRDKEGRQRFILSRPRNRDEFKNCSPYPLSFGQIYNVQDYQTMEYYTLKQPYMDAHIGIEAPTGVAFRISGQAHLSMDEHGDNPNLDKKTGAWLHSTAAPKCLKNSFQRCPCTVRLPKGLEGGDVSSGMCTDGGSLGDGESCLVSCAGGRSASKATCNDGVLVFPPLKCEIQDQQICTVPQLPPHTIYSKKPGDYVASKEKLTVTCEKGFRLTGGKEQQSFACFQGELSLGSGCQRCGKWTIKVKGARYQLKGWDKIKFNGAKTDNFEVNGVTTGSKEDPVKNCQEFGHPEQLLLQEKLSQTTVLALSCSNQEIFVDEAVFDETDNAWCS